jgi:hypothetical protein
MKLKLVSVILVFLCATSAIAQEQSALPDQQITEEMLIQVLDKGIDEVKSELVLGALYFNAPVNTQSGEKKETPLMKAIRIYAELHSKPNDLRFIGGIIGLCSTFMGCKEALGLLNGNPDASIVNGIIFSLIGFGMIDFLANSQTPEKVEEIINLLLLHPDTDLLLKNGDGQTVADIIRAYLKKAKDIMKPATYLRLMYILEQVETKTIQQRIATIKQ